MRCRSIFERWRAAKPWMPPWRISSAPQDARTTRSPSSGSSRSASATATRQATALRLSLAPGTTAPRWMSASESAAPALTAEPAAVSPFLPVIAPAATISGPPKTPHHSGTEVSARSTSPGNLRSDETLAALIEDPAGLRGVVVREQHQGPLRVGGPDLAYDVPGGPVRGNGLPHQARPVRGVVGDQSRGGCPDGRRERPTDLRQARLCRRPTQPRRARRDARRSRPGRSPPRRGHPRRRRSSRSAIQTAASCSPSEPARRSIGARASTTSRKVDSGVLAAWAVSAAFVVTGGSLRNQP